MSVTQNKSTKTSIAFKKAIGSITKALSMIESETYAECGDVLIHVDSAIGSLQSARGQIVERFLDKCVEDSINQKDSAKLKAQLVKLYKLSK